MKISKLKHLINVDLEKLRKQKSDGIRIPKCLIESKVVLIEKVSEI